jgi:DNA polymerase-3 subunit alpha (Gram-positive type)
LSTQVHSPNLLFESIEKSSLGCFEKERFLQLEILKVQLVLPNKVLVLSILMPDKVSNDAYQCLAKDLTRELTQIKRIIWDVHYPGQTVTPEDYLAIHQNDLMPCLVMAADINEEWSSHAKLTWEKETICVKLPHELARQQFEKKQCIKIFEKFLKQRIGQSACVTLEVARDLIPEEVMDFSEEKQDERAPELSPQFPKTILGNSFTASPERMETIRETHQKCVVQGEILSINSKPDFNNNARTQIEINVTDYSDSLEIKFWVDAHTSYRGGLKVKDWILVEGSLKRDIFRNKKEGGPESVEGDLYLVARNIVQVHPSERIDQAVEKRVELHCHTLMSRMDGLSKIDELVSRAAQWGHRAIAITDHGVVQAYPEAWVIAKQHKIKLILGMEGYLVDEFKKEKNLSVYHVIVLVKNKIGLKNLYRLVSESHLKYFYRRPLIPKALLNQYREGLIIGSACEQGEVWQHWLKHDVALEPIFDFYDYIELQPCENNMFTIDEGFFKTLEELQANTKKIYEFARSRGKMVLATGDSHFLDPQDAVYRKILHSGMGYGVERQAPLYFKTTDELKSNFDFFGEAIAHELVVTNPQKISDQIESIEPLPQETLSPHLENADAILRKAAEDRAKQLYGYPLPELIQKRLHKELDAIINNQFSTLYVIAMKLVQKSLEDGYLVGSRGSVGSSLVAFLCGITEVNPLPPHWRCAQGHYHEFPENYVSTAGVDLPPKFCPHCNQPMIHDGFAIAFEVFMGFHGDKMPDIDLNFSGEYQHIAHKYVEELFGKDHCFRAGTISAVKDRIAFGFVKKYVEETGKQVRTAELNRMVKGCSGVAKTTGQHPGGIVILPKNLEITDVCPVQYPADNKNGDVVTTHFDYDSMHDCLVKLDILGHDNPTSLRRLQKMTGVNPVTISLNDPSTMSLFSGIVALKLKKKMKLDLGTLGIPEFGTGFAMGMLRDTKPRKFEDLVRLSGLAHGTSVWMGNAQDLIRNKVATLSTVISTRDDMLTDLVAKKMDESLAFKIMESVRKGKGLSPDMQGAMQKAGIPNWYIDSCRKIQYIFPKAHAVAYCIMSFRIAYFKVHYPLAFYADYFTNKASGFNAVKICAQEDVFLEHLKTLQSLGKPTSKEQEELSILEVAQEMMVRGFEFLPVDLYRSDTHQFLIEKNTDTLSLRPPLITLSGLGDTAASKIVEERNYGDFTSVEDLVVRCGINKTVVEILRHHGCLQLLPESNQGALFK